jgi:hypothetical protein
VFDFGVDLINVLYSGVKDPVVRVVGTMVIPILDVIVFITGMAASTIV